MKVLVCCEESQVVTSAFRSLGHDAFSCDLLPTSGPFPEFHFQCDCREFFPFDSFDLVISHPPCTFLSNAGARWLYRGGQLDLSRYEFGLAACSFFNLFFQSQSRYLCIENPLPSRIFHLPVPSQIVQPYEFGDPWSKRTLLWLRDLPLLQPTDVLSDYLPYCSSGSYTRSHDSRYKGFSRSGGAARVRSRSFPGIAAAMAAQWSVLPC